MVTAIKKTRLRWAGYIVRMQDNLPCRKITLGTAEGRRRGEGQTLDRWMDGVRKGWELGTGGLRPWIEIDGGL
jgi:hypothetical protein